MGEFETKAGSTQSERQEIHRLRDFFVTLLLFLVVLSSLYVFLPRIANAELINVVRTFLILIGGVLPALIYNYFIQGRRPIFFREYKQNLRRLGLPENAQQYKDKFDTVYGSDTTESRVRLLNSPIVFATLLTFLGWLVVFFPLDPQQSHLTPSPTPLAYSFLGAYLFGLSSLARQYVTDDLQPRYYASLTTRYLTVLVLSWLITLILPGETAGGATSNALVVAFVVGLFPSLGLRLVQRAATGILGLAYRGFREPQPLSLLDGLNAYQEDRLLLEGIENLQNLASASVVDLMLKTRFPVEQIVDWIDQALLQLHTRDRFDHFRQSGLRTATDFLDAYEAAGLSKTERDERRKALARLLDSQQAGNPAESRSELTLALLDTIASALRNDPNLFHIRNWRDGAYEALPEDIERARTPADLKLMRGLPDEAIATYDQLLHDFPTHYSTLLYRGLARFAQGQYAAAVEDYSEAIRRGGSEWEGTRFAYLERGRALREQGDYEEAAAKAREAIRVYPDLPEARLELAFVQMTYLGQYAEAIENLNAVIDSRFKEKEAEALANRGVARYEYWKQKGRPRASRDQELQQAYDDLERALRLKPDLIPFYINLAHVLGRLGRLQDKEQALSKALAQLQIAPNPGHTYRVRLERGYFYRQQGKYQAAADDFRKATQLMPFQATAYVFLGSALRLLGQWDVSAEASRRATLLDPGFALAYEELGQLAFAQQRFEEAEQSYATALRLTRERVDRAAQARVHLGLGRVYRQLARLPDAQRELTSAIDLAQEEEEEIYTEATHELSRVLLALGQVDEAARLSSACAALYDVLGQARSSADAYLDWGLILLAQQNREAARSALETARDRLSKVFEPGHPADSELQNRINAALTELLATPADAGG